MGQCPGCRAWNAFAEEMVRPEAKPVQARGLASGLAVTGTDQPKPLSAITDTEKDVRIDTRIGELNRVLGGGLVQGSLTLIGGDPGIGKSTILLQVAAHLARDGIRVLYVSGEESPGQIKLRADRLGGVGDEALFLGETNLERIEAAIDAAKPAVVVIDSIQTVYHGDISSAPGSVSQVRESTGVLLRIAKTLGISILIVGHVTKEGTVAGPRVLEHMVDTVLYFEGDRHASYRILRAVKNRFGSTNEIGVFEMREQGLVEVKNPSEFMLEGRPEDAPGAVVTCSVEGTRPILLELQALVTRTNFGYPRRQATGTDTNRVNLLMAVLEKRLGIPMSEYDAYVNLAGGMKQKEPALDLSVVLAIFSGYRNVAIRPDMIAFGEVGLSGEVRAVQMTKERIREAVKMGFTTIVLPKAGLSKIGEINDAELIGVENIREAAELIH